jgi:branched-chain amino acid aminotransferase
MSDAALNEQPNPYSEGAAYVDGHFCPVSEATIPLTDLGFVRSDVTYDVVHVWNGRFFRLSDHLDRFLASCAKMRFSFEHSKDDLAEMLQRLVGLSGLTESYVNLMASRGAFAPGSRDPLLCRNKIYAFAIPFVWIVPMDEQEQGIDLFVSSTQRIPMASVDQTIKNFHWADLTKSIIEANEQGARLPVLLDADGNVTEGPGFNVFVYKDGRMFTPDTGVLHGITRKTVLELAERLNADVRVEAVPIDLLRSADEVFLSSTAGGVMPVRALDGVPFGDGAPGPFATQMRKLYWEAHEDPQFSVAVRYGAA